jgi:hypothetical protein
MAVYWQIFYSAQAKATLAGDYAMVPGNSGPWRPPQWSAGQASFTLLPIQSAGYQGTGTQQAFVFDGTLRAEHEQQTVVTLNPVQTGAAITDHAYVMPARLTVEIAMSDAMQSYTIGQWSSGPTRSISAYQTLKALQLANTPVSLATKLASYSLMMITDCRAEETKDTKYALKATVTFTEIFTGTVLQVQPTQAIAASLQDSQTAQSQGQPLLPGIDSYVVEPGITAPVPWAGNFSSIPYYGGTFPGMGSRIP